MANKVQIGNTVSGDLQENTWTFEMEEDIRLKAGRFAIIDISEFTITQKLKLEEFLNNL